MPDGRGFFTPIKALRRRNTLCISRRSNAERREKARPDGVQRLLVQVLNPYEEWSFEPKPFLVTLEEYGALFAPKELLYDSGRIHVTGYQLLNDASESPYYGVPTLFPFTHWETCGICEGLETDQRADALWCDEAYAMARRYYSLAVGFSAPDGTPYIAQESNYLQLLDAIHHRLFRFEPSSSSPILSPSRSRRRR